MLNRALCHGLCLVALLSAGCAVGGTAWLPLVEDPPGLLRLDMQMQPPQERFPGPFFAQRLLTEQRHLLWDGDGQWAADVPPGAYVSSDGQLIKLRHGDSAAAHAWSMVGMPVHPAADGHERAALAVGGQGYDPLSLFIHSWRLADGQPWPWVNHLGAFGGLANYLTRLSPDQGLHFVPGDGHYVDGNGRPVRIGGDPGQLGVSLVPGDVLSASEDQEVATMVILVADRGLPGVLDPEDIVVTAQDLGGAASWQVRQEMLGLVIGDRPLHAFRRNPQRLEEHLQQRLHGNNPVWTMTPERVWMLVAGMVILSVTLLRWGRRRRRQQSPPG